MYLEQLSNLDGVAGDEGRVREFIRQALRELPVEVRGDTLGNLLVRRPGPPGAPRVMLAAHMDEVGLMVTSIEKSGPLRFAPVGSLDARVLVAKTVRVGRDNIPGVIGCKAIHLQKPQERRNPYEWEHLFIDIGTRNKEETEKLVKPGEYVAFNTVFTALGDGCLRGKAFDDRAGCAVLLEILQEEYPVTVEAAFTVQEEVGARGAIIAAYALKPDLAVVLETTSAADTPETDKEFTATELGKGPALSFMDRSFMADRELVRQLAHTAEKNGIPYQFRRFTGGGTDAGAVSLSRQGVKAAVVSVPCRYIHSPSSVLRESDYRHTVALLKAWLKQEAKGWK